MKRRFTHTKCTVRLKKAESEGTWYVYIEAYPVLQSDGSLKREREMVGRTITTPIWTGKGTRLKPKRDENGIIQCRSQIDKVAVIYADEIRKIRQAEYDKAALYTNEEAAMAELKEVGEFDFIDYFDHLKERRHAQSSESIRINWKRLSEIMRSFAKGGPILFKTLDTKLLEEFKAHLLSSPKGGKKKGLLSQNSASTYFAIFKSALKQAFDDGYLQVDISSKVKGIPTVDADVQYLLPNEVQSLINTPCENDLLKRASLFSILTGLRNSDIIQLTWANIIEANGRYILKIRQQKTKVPIEVPIPSQAMMLCGTQSESNQRVFNGLRPAAWNSETLNRWMKNAGITKHITFHCFRHTFAVLQLMNGTSIYTVSKMMGHTSVKTTEIYADIVDSLKQKASEALTFDFSAMETQS